MLQINKVARLYLGVNKENESRTIEIDMSAWTVDYPNATVELLHKRQGDQTKGLTGATYDSETKILSWTPTTYDTFYEGFGIAEIRMVEGTVVKKTLDLIVTAVSPSIIDGTGEVIASDYQAWLDEVISNKQATIGAKEDAEAYAAGTRGGEPVESTDPAYHNNAKYYSDQAGDAAEAAEAAQDAAEDAQDAAEDAQEAAEAAQDAAEDAQEAAETAQGKAEDAQEAAETAQGKAEDAQDAAEAAASSIQTAGAEATTLAAGSAATAEIQTVGGQMKFLFGIPKGADGTGGGNINGIKMNGSAVPPDADHIVDLGTVITAHQDISGKADKASSPTSGNFAGLDSNGNLTDSGYKASDFLTAHQDISGKADKVSSPTDGNFAGLDSNGNLTDSGYKHGDYVTLAEQTLTDEEKAQVRTNIGAGSAADVATRARKFYFDSTATNAAVYAALSALDTAEVADVYMAGATVAAMTNNALTSPIAGTVAKVNGTTYRFNGVYGNNAPIALNQTGMSSTSWGTTTFSNPTADLDGLFVHQTTNISANSSKTFTIKNGTRALVICASTGGQNNTALLIVATTTSGAPTWTEVHKGSSLTISTSTNSMTISSSVSNTVAVIIFVFRGDMYEATT